MARLVNSRSTPATVPGIGASIAGGGTALGARITETGTGVGGGRGTRVGAVTGKRVGNSVGGGSGARVGAVTGNGVGGGSGARVGAVTGNGVGGRSGAEVVAVTGNGVGGGRGAATGNGVGGGRGAATGTGTGGGMVVPTGAEIGVRTGAGTVPLLLSMHAPCESKPTQSPTNRLEQSKYGRKVVTEIDTTVQLLHKSVSESGSLGLTNTSQTHESTERAMPVTQETATKLSKPKDTVVPLDNSTVNGDGALKIHNSYGTPESVS